ncbi:MAG: SoxR reducing system RseC family protein [Desulfobacterales bacterium]
MALEEGIVTRTNGETAFITTRRTTACEGCSERHVCHSMGNVKEIEIEVANPLGAKPGDTVLVAFKTSQLVTLSFMLYVFPIIAMLIGALFGNSVAENFSGDPSIFAAVFGFLFFGIAMSTIKLKDNQAKKTGQYRPVITEIKKKGPPGEPENLSGCTMCGPD